ncbi:hypothetical protein [Janthinobacterium agaricidamnosum]|uniref:Uncharacterized protein n=1 Tax=Janthinobacterium agaricidamnosum NBRC 102515 = DSM 9628 TaxID=1349767 RepID=W0VD79_9BURK|nr:hypothetical protein [Janthinobacterium agaricidamnosum]CDG85615.1 hypothetical protein GJA_5016 [Janthinobacterium agaricidamnosum NBRC 102515 = DSM 9628]
MTTLVLQRPVFALLTISLAISCAFPALAAPTLAAAAAQGASSDPHDLVKAAGVDLASPKPYQALAARMNSIMEQIEAIKSKRGK